MNFSDKIKFQREQNHLTQKGLAELVGVSQRAIAAYESSGTIARISTMRKLAHISKCCLRPFYDEYGNVYIVVDMELKGRIREALLKMICEFEIDEH